MILLKEKINTFMVNPLEHQLFLVIKNSEHTHQLLQFLVITFILLMKSKFSYTKSFIKNKNSQPVCLAGLDHLAIKVSAGIAAPGQSPQNTLIPG